MLVTEERAAKALARPYRDSGDSLPTTAWVLRAFVVLAIVFLCLIDGSLRPAIAFALALVPGILLVAAVLAGAFRFPGFLNAVHPLEPVLYRWLGVGLVKRIVATRIWPVLVGVVPPPRPAGRLAFLAAIEASTQGAEICHWPPLVLASAVAIFCLVLGNNSLAVWILAFNVLLNAYPIMLQRSNRWRAHRLRSWNPK